MINLNKHPGVLSKKKIFSDSLEIVPQDLFRKHCYMVIWHGDFKFATKNKYFYPMEIMTVLIFS